ncbi:MAG: histidine kinase [Halothece sp.]
MVKRRIEREEVRTTPTSTHSHYKRAVGIFKRREDLESTLHALKDSGYDMNRVSLIARHIEDVEGADEVTEKHGNEAKEGAAAGATAGTVLGGVGGFLVGVGLLAIPGIGPILAAGAEISAVASTFAGAGIGAAAGGIIGGLVGLGIPEEKAKVYNERVKAGDYLLMVSGTDDDIHRASSIMRDRHVEEFEVFNAPDLATSETMVTEERVTPRTEVTEKRVRTSREAVGEGYDLTGDNEPEVMIVDERDQDRQRDRIR